MIVPEAGNDKRIGGDDNAPVAMLLCADLMFAVQLQSIARATGFRPETLRPSASVPQEAAVLVVNLADRSGPRRWESAVREAASLGIPVIAFGPHMDTDARRAAKEAGASRVLANSNLARDLPTILRALRQDHT
ncbi:MAG TPA: hypothetical protein VJ183_03655 [Chloroflexia bacterium]|nr:hypothetical protein [Chloroflexia bacterium]